MLIRIAFKFEDTDKVKGERKKYTKQTRVIENCSGFWIKGKVNTRTGNIFVYKRIYLTKLKESIKEESVIILKVVGKHDPCVIIIGDFHTPQLAIDTPK